MNVKGTRELSFGMVTGTELFAASMVQDAAGDAIPHKVDVSKNSAVKYLNQDCKILRVYR
jgi:hypothetical protein